MGLFSSLRKVSKRAFKLAKPFVPVAAGALGGAGAEQIASQFLGGSQLPVPTTGRGRPMTALGPLPPITRPLPRPPGGGLPIIPGRPLIGGCPAGFHPAKDRSGRCVRNRRMNPLNPRAARRSIRRIKGAMKMLRQIERQLPKQRTRRAPAGHRARLSHE